jgi:hypothetical protein
MIIGLCGLAGSGKSTAARHLEAEHGFVILPFAGPLKRMARAFGLTAREMSGDLKEAPCDALCGRTPRQFMQWLGTEFGRQMIGEDMWVKAWQRELESARVDALMERGDDHGYPDVVADDVRFPNEAAAIRAMGGVVIRIARPGAGSSSGAAHASEAQGFPADLVILNTGTEADLKRQIDGALRMMARPAAAETSPGQAA